MLYPANATVRYRIAANYLLLNQPDMALHHADVLAARDDSYYIADADRERYLKERAPAAYRAFLSRSYLYHAYEVAWRASGGRAEHLRGMVTAWPNAEDVLALFFEAKRIPGE